MMRARHILLVMGFALMQVAVRAQRTDSIPSKTDSAQLGGKKPPAPARNDSLHRNYKDPHKATLYSAILPGAGQVYNGKYWKVPIVYVALGIPAYAFFYNKSWYEKCQYALVVANNGSQGASLEAVAPELRSLAAMGPSASNYIINYRNEFRKNQDYAALFFLIFWGLNIVDATVDAHLHEFNISNDLSFKCKPFIQPAYNAAGISLVFDLHRGKTRAADPFR